MSQEIVAGLVTRGLYQHDYQWNAGLGDWEFTPDATARSLIIAQAKTKSDQPYSAQDLVFSRRGVDLEIKVPESRHRLLLKEWFKDGNTWQINHVKYRNGPTMDDVWYGSFDWMSFSGLVPQYLPDQGTSPEQVSQAGAKNSADTPAPAVPPDLATPPGQVSQADPKTPADTPPEGTTSSKSLPPVDGGKKVMRGTAGEDDIHTGTSHIVRAGAGDDVIHVQHLPDESGKLHGKVLGGGRGDDMVDYRHAFSDSSVGIEASLAKRRVKWGKSGSDQLVNIEDIGGTDAGDRLEGDKRDNLLVGYRGDDHYKMQMGGGHDVILDHDKTSGNVDTLVFGPGIHLGLLSAERVGDTVVITIDAGDGKEDASVTIMSGLKDEYKIERFQLANGKFFTLDEIGLSPSDAGKVI